MGRESGAIFSGNRVVLLIMQNQLLFERKDVEWLLKNTGNVT